MKKMKMLLITLSVSFSAVASAAQYTCLNQDSEKAVLIISKNIVSWDEPWHSASSNAVFFGQEKAPFSERKGYNLFRLTSFYETNDSFYVLAISKINDNKLKATVYFDNDDREEEVTNYLCSLNH